MKKLAAQSLIEDPRLAQAKELLLAAVAEHSRELTGVRAPDPERAGDAQKMLEEFGKVRGGSLYYPYLGTGVGRGALVELSDGSVKYDMISGIGVHYLGHSHPALVAAGVDSAIRDTVMQGNLQQNVESVALSETLLKLASRKDSRLQHCFLTTSGAMANENALKMALQKRTPASRMLAFEHAFSGRTLAMAQITDKAAYRVGLPTALNVDYVPFFDSAHPAESRQRAIAVIEQHLHRFPGQHAAMCMELVLGEGGYYPGDREFFVGLIELLKKNNIAVWFDEIQTFGRTTHPFAFQHFDLDEYPDLVTVGKMTQVCATLFTDEYKPKPGLISQTFTGSTSAIFAAQAIFQVIEKEKLFGADGKIKRLSSRFTAGLDAIGKKHPDWIRGPFGIGAMIACSIFDGSDAITKKFLHKLYENGVIAFVAGTQPARLRFLMPVAAIVESDVDAVVGIVEKTLAEIASAQGQG